MAGLDEEMKLYVWGGGWGLPSIDPASLQCLVCKTDYSDYALFSSIS